MRVCVYSVLYGVQVKHKRKAENRNSKWKRAEEKWITNDLNSSLHKQLK